MKTTLTVPVLFLLLLLAGARAMEAQEIDPAISTQERQIGANTNQHYFLIQHKTAAGSANRHGLVVILPGGPGSRDFLPFCANVLTRYGIPEDFVVAELIAPQWKDDPDRVVWPGKAFPDPAARFTTEEFVSAVIDDVAASNHLDDRFIFTLGWSSSGHVLYSASTTNPKIRGSIIAMSRFMPEKMPMITAETVRGKNYFLYHSPADRVCPYREAELAVKFLADHGAQARLVSYKGGHGWTPNTYYCDRIKEGILWLKARNEPKTEPPPAR